MLGAITFAHEQIQPVIDLIIDLAEDAAKEPFDFSPPDYSALYETVKAAGEERMRAAYAITDKQERTARCQRRRRPSRPPDRGAARGPQPRRRAQEARIERAAR